MDRSFRYARRVATGLAQPSALVAATARLIDPVEKDIKSMLDAWYARIPWVRNGVPAQYTLGGEKILTGYGFEPEWLANTVRAYVPFKMGRADLSPADRIIADEKLRLSRVPRHLASYAVRPGEEAQSHMEVDLDDLGALELTPEQHAQYKVLAGGNRAAAKELGIDLPDKALQSAVKRLTLGWGPKPPRQDLSLDEYMNWLTTTKRFQDTSPGRGGGHEDLFRDAVIEYREMGRDMMLTLYPTLRARYDETAILHDIKKRPLQERASRANAIRHSQDVLHRKRVQDLGMPLALGIGAGP
jgi:hypothetical protein